jgi:molybdopterin molybdotransferase
MSGRPVSAGEARRLLAEALRPTESEEIPLQAAAGRVLARPVLAPEDLPAFPRSAMDGFALRAADGSAPRALVGSVSVGVRPGVVVGAGQAVAIPTGGHLPDGADAVVMVEQARIDGSRLEVLVVPERGRHVIRAGEDLARGAPALEGGALIGAPQMAVLAAFGLTVVPVHRRPRVAVLSTGSELSPPGAVPAPGMVRDVNQLSLGAAAAAAGAEVLPGGLVGDDPAALDRRLRALAPGLDLVLVSGGTSVGKRDHTAEVLETAGRLLFHGLHVRPGRPTAAALLDRTLVVALPGVPAAALIIFQAFVRSALERIGGRTSPGRPLRARLAARQESEPGREDYLRVRLGADGSAEVVPGPASSLSSLLASDGLAVVPETVATLEAGAEVDVWPWG